MLSKTVRCLLSVILTIVCVTTLASAMAAEHTLTVVGGTLSGSSETTAALEKDGKVNLTAPETSGATSFAYWSVETAGGGIVADPYSPVTSFTMPDGDVTVKANYVDSGMVLSIGGIADATVTYDGAAVDTADFGSPTIEGANVSELVYTYCKKVGEQFTALSAPPVHAGTYSLTVSLPSTNTSHAAHKTVGIVIQKRALPVSGLIAVNRAYNGTTAVAIQTDSAQLDTANWLSADGPAPTLAASNVSGTIDSPSAGSGKAITSVTGLTLSGGNDDYEAVASLSSLTCNIQPYELQANDLSWSDATYAVYPREYDGAASAITAQVNASGSASGFLTQQEASAMTVVVTDNTASNAGTHTAKAAAVNGNGNFTIGGAGLTHPYAISPKQIAIASVVVQPKSYNGAGDTSVQVTGVSFSGLVNGQSLVLGTDFTAIGALSSFNVGSANDVLVTVTLPASSNYSLSAAGNTYTSSANVTTTSISGTVTTNGVSGVTAVGGAISAETTAILPAAARNEAGALTYQWKRNGTAIQGATSSTYQVQKADAGQLITVAVSGAGSFTGTTSDSAGVRIAPQALTGSVSISGNNVLGGTLTATPIIDNGAATSADYAFQWYQGANPISGAVNSTYIIGENDLGKTITVRVSAVTSVSAKYAGFVESAVSINAAAPASPTIDAATSIGAISISWNTPNPRGSAITGYKLTVVPSSGTPYAISIDKSLNNYSLTNLVGGQNYSVRLSAINAVGSTDSATMTVTVKGAYSGATPAAPTRYSRTTTKIVLTAFSGYEYSMDGVNWQSSNEFSGLKAGKSYTFYQRIKETSSMAASPVSAPYKTSTLSSSSESGSSSGSSSSGSGSGSSSGSTSGGSSGSSGTGSGAGTGSGTASGTSSGSTLYELSLTDSTSNVLFTAMNKLIAGNKEKDVTIKFSNLEYTFAKGTMVADAGKVWYDFGYNFNGSEKQDRIKTLAGDKFIISIHFNYSGTLPGEATIRINLGSNYAGQTLMYYKYDPAADQLTFSQQSTVDANGWATVTQSACSDYVFTKADPAASVSPSPTPALTPAPTETANPDAVALAGGNSNSGPNWKLIGIIAGIVLVLIGILWLWLKKNSENEDDELDEL